MILRHQKKTIKQHLLCVALQVDHGEHLGKLTIWGGGHQSIVIYLYIYYIYTDIYSILQYIHEYYYCVYYYYYYYYDFITIKLL